MSALQQPDSPALSARDMVVEVAGRRIVNGVSFDVQPGEWLNLVGPNGAGKTTLLRVLAGLQRAEGALTVDGRDTHHLRRRDWSRRVALVPQSPLVPPGMTVAEYVLLGRTAHIHPLASESRHDLDVAAGALQRLDLLEFADRMVDTLSGGERQRVLVARLLAQDAPIALLDEPTSALDVGHQQQVLDLVEHLRRTEGLTVIATMHDLTMAGQYGDRIALMVDGRIVSEGTAATVLTESVLSLHYGARVRIVETEDGPIVVPVRQERR